MINLQGRTRVQYQIGNVPVRFQEIDETVLELDFGPGIDMATNKHHFEGRISW